MHDNTFTITSSRDSNRRSHLLVVGLIGLIAILWTMVESLPVLLAGRYSLYQIVWTRYAAHLAALALWLGPRRTVDLLRTRRPGLQIGRGLLMLVMPAAFITAVGRMAPHNVLAVFWLCPLMILTFAATVLRERAGWWAWLGVAVSVVGAQLILQPDGGALRRDASGAALALVMGLAFSLYVVLTRALRTESRTANLIFTAACVFVPLSFVMPAVWQMPSLQDTLIMTTIGLVGLGLLWALDRVCEETPVSSLAAFMPLQLVCSVALAVALGDAAPGRMALTGCALIASVAVAAFVRASRLRSASESGRLNLSTVNKQK